LDKRTAIGVLRRPDILAVALALLGHEILAALVALAADHKDVAGFPDHHLFDRVVQLPVDRAHPDAHIQHADHPTFVPIPDGLVGGGMPVVHYIGPADKRLSA
jgi:hypothetical protein